MTEGLDEARDRRNLLERLGDKIPGFRGFQDRELRREVDKLQREHLGAELTALKGRLREKARSYTDAGRLDALKELDHLERRLDGLSQSVRFADYGATGFFDVVKVYEEELDRLYRFDLSLLDDLAALKSAVEAVPAPGGGDVQAAASHALSLLAALEEKWRGREQVMSNVVRTG
jgi:hypothetical protein